jgi:hypothetical protein
VAGCTLPAPPRALAHHALTHPHAHTFVFWYSPHPPPPHPPPPRVARCWLVHVCMVMCVWVFAPSREKAIFHTLNLFEPYMQGMLRGQAWVLRDLLPQVNEAVARTHQHAGTLSHAPNTYVHPLMLYVRPCFVSRAQAAAAVVVVNMACR